jgi:signal transduction histidine kinase
VSAPIVVDLDRRDTWLEVRILDAGDDVSEEEIASLFDPFYRAEQHVASTSGIGIGLTVCKRLVEAQGGTIWAKRTEAGGTEFGFTLPYVHLRTPREEHAGLEPSRRPR